MTVLFALMIHLAVSAQPYAEAPMLRDRVRAGTLPPVEQRLPDEPVIVEPVHTLGEYGGTWRRLTNGPSDMGLNSRLGYETLLRWDRIGRRIIPGVAERWEMNDDATEFVFHLRRGMKWSDGHPLTSDDFRFYYEHIDKHASLEAAHAPWKKLDGRLYDMAWPDRYTVVIRFRGSYGSLPQMLAYRGSQGAMFAPKHYLQQFHEHFEDRDMLDAQARQAGFVGWSARFMDRMDLEKNPHLPTVNPFVCKIPFPAPRCLAVRNPYY